MKKVLLIILVVLSTFFLGACDKKSYQVRTMEFFFEDFEVTGKNIKLFEEIIKDEKGPNKMIYTDQKGEVMLIPKNKTLIKTITFTIYNYAEDYSFYIYDPSVTYFEKVDGIYRTMGLSYENRVEIKSGSEFDVVYNVNCKVGAGKSLRFASLLCPRQDDVQNDMSKIIESYGAYKFKVDYEVCM